MFGESESESPQVPSPWDSLISLSSSPVPTPSPRTPPIIPKLVPEAEEGNVEYKLQLLSPSPARFARLVTQLKWRLLEGGGQAYYELGVADSGALIGLPRAELEQTLETLEMMAGEIGASVIVVKEIEVPAAISGLAAEETDKWNRKRQWKKAKIAGDITSSDFDEDEGTTTEGTTTGASATESESEGAVGDMSPAIFSFDDGLNELSNIPPLDQTQPSTFLLDLEISSVFKPRPFRTRLSSSGEHLAQSVLFGDEDVVTKDKRRSRKHYSNHAKQLMPGLEATSPDEYPLVHPPSHGRRKANRRMARDRRRAEKRNALISYADNSLSGLTGSGTPLAAEEPVDTSAVSRVDYQHPVPASCIKVQTASTDELVSGLQGLHVTFEPKDTQDDVESSSPGASHPEESLENEDSLEDADGDNDLFASPTPFSSALSNSVITIKPDTDLQAYGAETTDAIPIARNKAAAAAASSQARMIVEALVVRKMSMEEAFLDFEGFQLI